MCLVLHAQAVQTDSLVAIKAEEFELLAMQATEDWDRSWLVYHSAAQLWLIQSNKRRHDLLLLK